MIDPKIIEDLGKRFVETLPPGFKQLHADLEKNFHAALQATFAKLDLVTREEFDVQQAVLARTRAKLEILEKELMALEEKLASSESTPTSPTKEQPVDPAQDNVPEGFVPE